MSYTILIAEDNAANKTLIKDILTMHGYKIAEARDGDEAIGKARELLPDLILMDIQMPGMDGMTAGVLLKGDPVTSGIKIIALTSFAMCGDREKFLAAGFDGYLAKPIDTRKLPDLVKGWLDRKEKAWV